MPETILEQITFVSMFDLMNKLSELKSKMEEARTRLDAIRVNGSAGDHEVKVVMNGNKKILSVDIAAHLLFPEKKEQVEELVEVAFSRALAEAENVHETEMKAAGRDLLPGLPF